jgi:hypothetical protein
MKAAKVKADTMPRWPRPDRSAPQKKNDDGGEATRWVSYFRAGRELRSDSHSRGLSMALA